MARTRTGKRPGPGQPPKICDEAIDLAVDLLSHRATKATVKAALKKQFSVHVRTCETIITRAREAMVRRSGLTKDQHRTDALAFYEAIIRDNGSPAVELVPALRDEAGNEIKPAVMKPARTGPTFREKLHAQEQIDKLLGLQVPQKVELTGAGGGPLKAIVGVFNGKSLADHL